MSLVGWLVGSLEVDNTYLLYNFGTFENYNCTSKNSGFHCKISYAIETGKTIILSKHHQISQETTCRERVFLLTAIWYHY